MASELKVDTIKHTNNTSAITLDTSGNVTLAGSANNLGTVSAGTFNGTIGTSATMPSGSVLQLATGLYQCTGDISITTTSETYGPVVSMVMKSQNAKIFALVNHGESYAALGAYEMKASVAYKSSSFTAGQGNASHGATSLNDTQIFFRIHDSSMSTVVASGTMSNSIGDTIYFAPYAFTVSGTGYPNYGGQHTNISLTVFEIKA